MGSGITLSQKSPGKVFIISLKKNAIIYFEKKANKCNKFITYLYCEYSRKLMETEDHSLAQNRPKIIVQALVFP